MSVCEIDGKLRSTPPSPSAHTHIHARARAQTARQPGLSFNAFGACSVRSVPHRLKRLALVRCARAHVPKRCAQRVTDIYLSLPCHSLFANKRTQNTNSAFFELHCTVTIQCNTIQRILINYITNITVETNKGTSVQHLLCYDKKHGSNASSA